MIFFENFYENKYLKHAAYKQNLLYKKVLLLIQNKSNLATKSSLKAGPTKLSTI